jgi:hypothetical protein
MTENLSPDIEAQKFIAFEGICAWAEGVIKQAKRLYYAEAAIMQPLLEEKGPAGGWRSHQEVVQQVRVNKHDYFCQRHYFILAANKLNEYRKWCKKLGLVPNSVFAELDHYKTVVNELRDMNEHIIEYFQGKGRKQDCWLRSDEFGTADASTTMGRRLGGRLDWIEFQAVAARLLEKLREIDAQVGRNGGKI